MRRLVAFVAFVAFVAALAACSSPASVGAPSGAAHEDLDPSTAFDGPMPASCRGTLIDLERLGPCLCKRTLEVEIDGKRAIRAGAWCGPAFDEKALPPAIRATLTPAQPSVAAGESVELVLSLTNTGADATPLRFAARHPVQLVRVFDARGQDVTRTGDCSSGASSSRDDHLVILEPRGEARFRLPWRASSLHGELTGDDCKLGPRPYEPGTYRIEVATTAQGFPSVSATVQVGGK